MEDKLAKAELAARMLSILLALDMVKNFISPALWIIGEYTSVVSTTARLATSPESLAIGWFFASILVAPYVAVQLFWPDCKIRRELTKLACKGLCFGGVLWVYMAYLSKNLDYGIATAQFITNGIASVSLGAVLAYGLNSDQIYYEKNERAV